MPPGQPSVPSQWANEDSCRLRSETNQVSPEWDGLGGVTLTEIKHTSGEIDTCGVYGEGPL